MLRNAARTIRDERLWCRGDTVLCACSGGPDSTALLHVVALLRRTFGHAVIACGIDHGLRPEAPAELDAAERVALALEVPFFKRRVDLPPGSNLQARARAARYAALEDVAVRRGACVIATGHTADDRAETVLLRLLRGAGPRGLAVLPPRSPAGSAAAVPSARSAQPPHSIDRVRPLIRARRTDVLAHLRRHTLAYAADPTNADPRYARVRVRHELLPLLVALSPKIVEHLCALADMMSGQVSADDPFAALGRAQRQAIERARRLGERSVRLRLRGGREVEVTFPDGTVLIPDE